MSTPTIEKFAVLWSGHLTPSDHKRLDELAVADDMIWKRECGWFIKLYGDPDPLEWLELNHKEGMSGSFFRILVWCKLNGLYAIEFDTDGEESDCFTDHSGLYK